MPSRGERVFMSLQNQMEEIARKAREASRQLMVVSAKKKDAVLAAMADGLSARQREIVAANEQDLQQARKMELAPAMIDRLTLSEKRLQAMIDGLRTVRELPDPVGEVLKTYTRPNGLKISKVRVPIGVVCIIYESRPNVTVDSAGLCFKSGNCAILRGGKESINSNLVLARILQEVLREQDLPPECIQVLETTDRKAVPLLLRLPQYIDLVIPRGGEALIRAVVEESQIPVIKHYKGICHVYVDKDADLEMAARITVNAKTQRPGVCNAAETLLVHQDVAANFLPSLCEKLTKEHKVELRGCPASQALVAQMKPATEEDWHTEYLDLVLAVRVVDNLSEAVNHINKYGSGHSDTIVTGNKETARKFTEEIDSACVFVNASTRFSDGGQFGMGAEIGISTDKIHARGPMGLEELTSYKYIVRGKGQLRE